jgi:hypothetical protein
MPARFDPPGECPVCGAEVQPNAMACNECGACHASGWSEQAAYDALDLPNDEFDYPTFVADEFGEDRRELRRRWWAIVAVIGLILLLLFWLWVAG